MNNYIRLASVLLLSVIIGNVAVAQDSWNMTLLNPGVFNYPNGEGAPDEYSDVWGYYDSISQREYAVVGARGGTDFYALDEDNIDYIGSTNLGGRSVWRDIKDYGEFIYISVDEPCRTGLVIVSKQGLRDGEVRSQNFSPNLETPTGNGRLRSAHNIYIDERGFLYISGSNAPLNGVLVFDLKQNPQQPEYIGTVGQVYSHDVFVQDGLLGSSDIFDGFLSLWDVTEVTNPQFISVTRTPGNFTHNAWFSADNQYAFTTDEIEGGVMAAYDISNLDDPQLMDVYAGLGATNPQRVIPHNAHFFGDNLVALSHYTEGIIIMDVENPTQITEIGYYDTYPRANGSGFSGCWGVYPYLPSGKILVSDINSGFYVFENTADFATNLTATVIDSISGEALDDVNIELNAFSRESYETDGGLLDLRFVYPDTSHLTITFSKDGYETKTVLVESQSSFYEKRDTINLGEVALTSETTSSNPDQQQNEEELQLVSNLVQNTLAFAEPQVAQGAQVSIYETCGRKVWSGVVASEDIDVTQLISGHYILSVSKGQSRWDLRFVKKE